MNWLYITAIVLISIITAVYIYFKNAFNYWRSRGIPTEEPTFPFGNIKGFGTTLHHSIITQRVYNKFKGVSKFCGFYILAGSTALLTDLDLIKSVLVKDFSNFSDKDFYSNEEDDPLSAHLFSLDGEKWKNLRQKLTPTFTSGKMKFMFGTVVEVGERFNECLREIIQDNNEVEIKDLLARFTTDVIGTCAFGIECNSLKDPSAEFKNKGEKAFIPRYYPPIQILVHGFKDISKRLRLKIIPDDVSEFFLNMVRETVEYRENNNINRNDFMDILIKLKNDKTSSGLGALTLNEVAAQAFLFFLAGFETSSTTLMFCLYELAKNPDLQTKARKSVQDAYKKHGQLTYEMMMDMPYIDHLLQETLRKYPPVSVLSRVAKNDYKVPGTEHIIEKGTIVIIPAFAIQRDPEYYPDPEKFDPERFSSEEFHKRDSMTWLPFGEGPRNCIGSRFGMMQSRIGLITLLKNFEFSLSPKTVEPISFIPKSFVLNPKGGVYLKLKAIN